MIKLKLEPIDAYTYDELSEESRGTAADNEIHFLTEMFEGKTDYPEFIQKAFDKSRKMQTPWFFGQYVWEYGKEEVEASCREYLYSSSGVILCRVDEDSGSTAIGGVDFKFKKEENS